MTRQEIRDMSRKKLGETTSAFWTDSELNTYINLGCKDVAWRSKSLRTTGNIVVSSCEAGTVSQKYSEFTISTYLPDCFAVNEVYFKQDNEDYVRLEPTTREELDALDPAWQSLVGYTADATSGTPTYNFDSTCSIPQKYYWSREEDVIGIYPPPDDGQDGADLKVYYSYNHSDLSGEADIPTLPTPLHLAVVDFVAASGLEDRGWGDRANDMWQKYFSKIKDYAVEKKNEREDDEIIMKSYRNI